jgi:hypothetical protein
MSSCLATTSSQINQARGNIENLHAPPTQPNIVSPTSGTAPCCWQQWLDPVNHLDVVAALKICTCLPPNLLPPLPRFAVLTATRPRHSALARHSITPNPNASGGNDDNIPNQPSFLPPPLPVERMMPLSSLSFLQQPRINSRDDNDASGKCLAAKDHAVALSFPLCVGCCVGSYVDCPVGCRVGCHVGCHVIVMLLMLSLLTAMPHSQQRSHCC